jgi:hypothetical protein
MTSITPELEALAARKGYIVRHSELILIDRAPGPRAYQGQIDSWTGNEGAARRWLEERPDIHSLEEVAKLRDLAPEMFAILERIAANEYILLDVLGQETASRIRRVLKDARA